MHLDLSLLTRFNRPVPRYTSYPTAPHFRPLDDSIYRQHLARANGQPISLYIHLPFCRSMCLFCGCSVVLNRKPERQSHYVSWLLREITLLSTTLQAPISQLHFGGGTPTSLTIEELQQILSALHRHFSFTPHAEISIEIDPRTVFADRGEKLTALKHFGFNRVSFGVQDLDPKVQEAVKRRQSEEMSRITFERARSLGFLGINIDLIYGLPFQTLTSFERTAQTIASWQPDRIALFSYARTPWLKKHQQAIPEHTLPSTEEKLAIYLRARETFLSHGYIGIGMDHFALSQDPLAHALSSGTLHRNFQGYSLRLANNLIGLGITSIGFIDGAYFQNVKSLEEYETHLSSNHLPIHKGFLLSPEDRLRHWVIQELMCRFEVNKKTFQELFSLPFETHFQYSSLKAEGLLEETPEKLLPTPLGRIFIRLIASAFDSYLTESPTYSKLI